MSRCPASTVPGVASTPVDVAAASAPRAAVARPLASYLEQTAQPLANLLFLLPLIVVYEVGTRWYAFDPINHTEQRIIAFSLMQRFFAFLGTDQSYLRYMPAGLIVAVLMSAHVFRGSSQRRVSGFVGPWHLIGMGAESIVYALPLRLAAVAFSHYLPLYSDSATNCRALLVLSIGAGVYEEMMFRLVAYVLLSVLLIDLLKLPRRGSWIAIILISALGFAAYHYLGNEAFQWRSFAFRTLAGIYFGAIFLTRGLGVTAGSHAAYDISTFALRLAAHL